MFSWRRLAIGAQVGNCCQPAPHAGSSLCLADSQWARGVGMSADAAGKSACATSLSVDGGGWVVVAPVEPVVFDYVDGL